MLIDGCFICTIIHFQTVGSIADKQCISVNSQSVRIGQIIKSDRSNSLIICGKFKHIQLVDCCIPAGLTTPQGYISIAIVHDYGIATGNVRVSGNLCGHQRILKRRDNHSVIGSQKHLIIIHKHGFNIPAQVLFVDKCRNCLILNIEYINSIVIDRIQVFIVQSKPGHRTAFTEARCCSGRTRFSSAF